MKKKLEFIHKLSKIDQFCIRQILMGEITKKTNKKTKRSFRTAAHARGISIISIKKLAVNAYSVLDLH